MRCPRCGAETEPNDIFCGECGTRLEEIAASTAAAEPAADGRGMISSADMPVTSTMSGGCIVLARQQLEPITPLPTIFQPFQCPIHEAAQLLRSLMQP
jgi:hypothetical protein